MLGCDLYTVAIHTTLSRHTPTPIIITRNYRVAYTTEDAGNYFYVGPGEVERHHVEHYLPGLGKHLRIVVEYRQHGPADAQKDALKSSVTPMNSLRLSFSQSCTRSMRPAP